MALVIYADDELILRARKKNLNTQEYWRPINVLSKAIKVKIFILNRYREEESLQNFRLRKKV